MKVIAINASPRKDSNTAALIRRVFEELEATGIQTELIQLSGQKLRGCTACYQCWDNQDLRCAVDDDALNHCLAAMLAADGVIISSPVYFGDLTAEAKALIDRCGMVGFANHHPFKRKVGAPVVAGRRHGAVHTSWSITNFFQTNQFIIPGSCSWNVGLGQEKGEVDKDEEGLRNMATLGQNMAWIMKKIEAQG